jgi:DNA polymerase elongation subunit (family B)
MQTTGWLFDLYPLNDRMVLWFITAAGERLRVEDEFPYRVYLGGEPTRIRALAREAARRGWIKRYYVHRGRDLWSGEDLPVVALELASCAHLGRLRGWLGALKEGVEVYNADLDRACYYLYSRRLHPCAWYEMEVQAGRLLHISLLEEPFAVEFAPPPLAVMTLGLTRDPLIPLGAGNTVAVGWEGRTLELEAPDISALIEDLAGWLKRLDPDLILSDWGDEEIIPLLWQWSRQHRMPLPLDRELPPIPRNFNGGRSYFSYGRIVYQGPAAPCYGRWHVDRRNSFYYKESGLMGLAQIARIGQMPLQQAARASPGTLITSMQLARAARDGILIPWRKGEPERFKTAAELLVIDKGGLTFMPPIGLFFNVAELDFASMYPTIMTIHNISPETVNCPCCASDAAGQDLEEGARGGGIGFRPVDTLPPSPNPLPPQFRRGEPCVRPGANARFAPTEAGKEVWEESVAGCRLPVASNSYPPKTENRKPKTAPPRPSLHLTPEAGYRLCRRREGLVPRTLRPILKLREELKARAKEVGPEEAGQYKDRQNALKWMLVTCFGYLGYKNARFGRIEAHEAVTAHGRDKLLTAKEICEDAGFQVLHGLTDCLWIKKDGMMAEELEGLCREISRATGVKLALEGVYKWLAFLPSRQDPRRPVATRYFGAFADGSLKVRGLACRRRDTPPFVRRAQEALLAKMAQAGTPEELAALRPELEDLAESFRQRLREGLVRAPDLMITRVLSQPVADYKVDTPTALAARQLEKAGIHLQPGEKLRYVHREPRRGPKELRVQAAPLVEELEDYDAAHYLELLDRAVGEILLMP